MKIEPYTRNNSERGCGLTWKHFYALIDSKTLMLIWWKSSGKELWYSDCDPLIGPFQSLRVSWDTTLKIPSGRSSIVVNQDHGWTFLLSEASQPRTLPSKHTTLFKLCNNVVDIQTTLYQRQNDVVCLLDSLSTRSLDFMIILRH